MLNAHGRARASVSFSARLKKMQVIGSLILGMILTVVAVALMIVYVIAFIIGIGWLGQKLESLKNAWKEKKPASPRVRSNS